MKLATRRSLDTGTRSPSRRDTAYRPSWMGLCLALACLLSGTSASAQEPGKSKSQRGTAPAAAGGPPTADQFEVGDLTAMPAGSPALNLDVDAKTMSAAAAKSPLSPGRSAENPACSHEATQRIDLGRDIPSATAKECRPRGLQIGKGSLGFEMQGGR